MVAAGFAVGRDESDTNWKTYRQLPCATTNPSAQSVTLEMTWQVGTGVSLADESE